MINGLGVQPRPVEESIIDLCYSLVELGIVKKTHGYLGHPSTRPTPPPQETPADQGEAESAAAGDQAQDQPAEAPPSSEGQKDEGKPAEGQTEEGKPEGETGGEEEPTS